MKKDSSLSGIISLILYLEYPEIKQFLIADGCYNERNVWDEKENLCRNDCVMISKINACMQMTPEQGTLYAK